MHQGLQHTNLPVAEYLSWNLDDYSSDIADVKDKWEELVSLMAWNMFTTAKFTFFYRKIWFLCCLVTLGKGFWWLCVLCQQRKKLHQETTSQSWWLYTDGAATRFLQMPHRDTENIWDSSYKVTASFLHFSSYAILLQISPCNFETITGSSSWGGQKQFDQLSDQQSVYRKQRKCKA